MARRHADRSFQGDAEPAHGRRAACEPDRTGGGTSLLLVDHLPAGFEIDNPRIVAGGETGNLKWIGQTTGTAHTEFRDDRFVAAFDRSENEKGIITVAYIVRAVSPGRYAHPPAIIEDMYRPDRFARTEAGMVEVQPATR